MTQEQITQETQINQKNMSVAINIGFGGLALFMMFFGSFGGSMGLAFGGILWLFIYCFFIFTKLLINVEAYQSKIMRNTLDRKQTPTDNPRGNNSNDNKAGLFVVRSGFNWVPPLSVFVEKGTIDLKKKPLFEKDKKETFGTKDGLQVIVSAAVYWSVVVGEELQFYGYDPETIPSFFLGKIKRFFETEIIQKTKDENIAGIKSLNDKFVHFVNTDDDLLALQKRFGIGLSDASVFDVFMTEGEKTVFSRLQEAMVGAKILEYLKKIDPNMDSAQSAMFVQGVLNGQSQTFQNTVFRVTGAGQAGLFDLHIHHAPSKSGAKPEEKKADDQGDGKGNKGGGGGKGGKGNRRK